MLEDTTVITSLLKKRKASMKPWKLMPEFLPPPKGTNSSTDYYSDPYMTGSWKDRQIYPANNCFKNVSISKHNSVSLAEIFFKPITNQSYGMNQSQN